MVNKSEHPIKGNGFNCECCGFMYEKITHARNCESFCKKFGRFSLENVQRAIGRLELDTAIQG